MNLLNLDDPADRLLGRCLRRQAEAIPDTDFIVWDDQHFSYGRVNELANACAVGLAALGVGRGDTVSFLMETCPDWVWLTAALNKDSLEPEQAKIEPAALAGLPLLPSRE